jgi:conjugal transfer pilus assembly protein TraE
MLTTHKTYLLDFTKAMNALLFITAIALLIANILLTAGIFYAVKQHTVTIVPPKINQEFTLSNHSVDESYLKQMAEYFLYLKLNISPETVGRNYSQLLQYVDTSRYHEVQPKLIAEANRVKQQKISSTLLISKVEVSSATQQVKITGTLKKWVGSRALAEETITYLVTMQYHNVLTLIGIQHASDGS